MSDPKGRPIFSHQKGVLPRDLHPFSSGQLLDLSQRRQNAAYSAEYRSPDEQQAGRSVLGASGPSGT